MRPHSFLPKVTWPAAAVFLRGTVARDFQRNSEKEPESAVFLTPLNGIIAISADVIAAWIVKLAVTFKGTLFFRKCIIRKNILLNYWEKKNSPNLNLESNQCCHRPQPGFCHSLNIFRVMEKCWISWTFKPGAQLELIHEKSWGQ